LRDRDYNERKKQSQEEALIHSGNRVVAAWPERMTAKNPTSRESNAFHHPITPEGFKRVGRARWIVTAASWKER
jgi:hypothetical protein